GWAHVCFLLTDVSTRPSRPRSSVAGLARPELTTRSAPSSQITVGSHAEDAEVRHRGGCRVGGGDLEREAEHAAGVAGVDHAVVPEAGGGVVRRALSLVLLADRRLERLLVVGAPALAAALDAVAAH